MIIRPAGPPVRRLVALEAAQPEGGQRRTPDRSVIATCDRKLARLRAALEAGADPVLIEGWIREAQAERDTARQVAAPAKPDPQQRRLTCQEIKDLVDGLGGLLKVPNRADPEDKAEVSRRLGLRLTYDHETRTALADVDPRSTVGLVFVSEGGLDHYAYALRHSQRLVLSRP